MKFTSYLGPPPQQGPEDFVIRMDYYQRPFHLMIGEHLRMTPNPLAPHPMRSSFWGVVPTGTYHQLQARELLATYHTVVEEKMAEVIENSSLTYWIHLLRRLSPGPIGENQHPRTIMLTRAIVEAAVQNYAHSGLCNRIGVSADTPIEMVLGGMLMDREFDLERALVEGDRNQIVLTAFSQLDLAEFFGLEKLAYEIWRIGATYRVIGKGSSLVVGEAPEGYWDDRDPELAGLIKSYDSRHNDLNVSATGTVFGSTPNPESAGGHVFLPVYNVKLLAWEKFSPAFEGFSQFNAPPGFFTNFIWFPFDLRGYRNAHKPLMGAFKEKHGVSVDSIIGVVAALCWRVISIWIYTKGNALMRFHQRAYEGAFTWEQLREEIVAYLPMAITALDMTKSEADNLDVDAGLEFWTRSTCGDTEIDLIYPGPHSLVLPLIDDKVFVDYAWISRRLFDLFWGLSISDQSFKGKPLENLLRSNKSRLPTKPCRATDGSSREIDFATGVDDCLIIAECKAVSRSIGFDRGDPAAIAHRRKFVIEKSLAEANDKGRWLAQNPKGRNYDISEFRQILPVGVSPFLEFIPKKDTYYWIDQQLPRVVTPSEFAQLSTNPDQVKSSFNKIQVVAIS